MNGRVPVKKETSPILKALAWGCGTVIVVTGLGVAGCLVWLASLPEGGVTLPNQMDDYAIEYLEEHEILEPGEELLAYYDATISMDGTEAAIVTDQRVIYHKDGRNTSMPLGDIASISHGKEFLGDKFLIEGQNGNLMEISIAEFNEGDLFGEVLSRAADKPIDEMVQ